MRLDMDSASTKGIYPRCEAVSSVQRARLLSWTTYLKVYRQSPKTPKLAARIDNVQTL